MGVISELLIKLGLQGQAETKAGIDEVTAKVEKLGAAQVAAGAAAQTGVVAQGAALKELDQALATAQQALDAWKASAAQVGVEGAKGLDEYLKAVNDVDLAIGKVQATGGPIPKDTVKGIDDFRAGLVQATGAVAEHATTVGKATDAHLRSRIETDAGRAAFGRWALVIKEASESSNSFVSAIGKMLLPLAAAAGALVLFNKVAKELQERGVDILTVADRWSSVMDSLAVAFGGTTRAALAASNAFAAAQSKMDDLDATQRKFATGLDLLTGLGLDAQKSFEAWGVAITNLEGDLGGLAKDIPASLGAAEASLNLFNQRLGEIRAVSPALATQFAADFQRLVKAVQDGVAGSGDALHRLNEDEKAAAEKSRATITDFGKHYSLVFNAAAAELGKFSAIQDDAVRHMEQFRAAGMSEREVFAAMKPELAAISELMSKYGGEIAKLAASDPVLKGHLASLQALANEYPAATDKVKEFVLKVQEENKSFNELLDSIDRATKRHGDYKAALESEHAQIDSEILSLERQKATLKGLDDAQQAHLNILLALHAVMTPLTAEEEAHNKAQDAGVKTVHDLSKSYEELTKAREKDKLSIEDHRKKFIAEMDAELRKAVESGNAQVAELDRQFKAQELSQTQYNQAVNEIFAKEAIAHRKTMEAEDKANKEADKNEKEHAKTYEDAVGEIARSLDKLGETLVTAKGKQADYDAATEVSLLKVRGQWDLTSKKVAEHAGEYPKLEISLKGFEGTVTSVTKFAANQFDDLKKHIQEVKKAIDDCNEAASNLTVTGGGAGFTDVVAGGSTTAAS